MIDTRGARQSTALSWDQGARERPEARGKFLYIGGTKAPVRGVTYGPFRPDSSGNVYGDRETAERDFAAMAAHGINAVRLYTVPPRWLLDTAQQHGLRVMVGLSWEQHITFLDSSEVTRGIVRRVRAAVQQCAGHPAVLCYAIGNEIPASIVRWHGAHRVERFLRRLYDVVKQEDPESLATYVNFPSTEYLDLPFVDLVCFNVYLDEQDRLEAYLARLQNIAGNRPLLLSEIGLDSRRNGLSTQASTLGWQIQSVFGAGAAGAFVFAWTDEWHRGGQDIEDWDFGLTDRERRPKLALEAVTRAYARTPLPPDLPWPRISVVVCTYNGSRTIGDCCQGLTEIDYPDFEVIVVDDGSTDGAGDIAAGYGFRVVRTANQGLSAARNAGMAAANGEIIAYVDDDARPDPHWLQYLAASFVTSGHAGFGGPNIAPPGDGSIAECVANAPGGPVHVLLADTVAEHVPGCNLAVRKEALETIGGFDPRFRVAGDDVDVCWRLQERGWTLGFSPAALVWHHRRNSVRTYWNQQRGYGKAEALLEAKWPERYNRAGHLHWNGRIYGQGLTLPVPWGRQRIYGGTFGSAPFQSLYQPAPGLMRSLPLMPEWYLVIALLGGLTLCGLLWRPLLLALAPLLVAATAPVVQAATSAAAADFSQYPRRTRLQRRALTALLHLMQPGARLWGRIAHGLTLWRSRGSVPLVLPGRRTASVWSAEWQQPALWLERLAAGSRHVGATVLTGGAFDQWDLEIRTGQLGAARVLSVSEEHDGGAQVIRFVAWPCVAPGWAALAVFLAALGVGAAHDGAWIAAALLLAASLLVCCRMLLDLGRAAGAVGLGLRTVCVNGEGEGI